MLFAAGAVLSLNMGASSFSHRNTTVVIEDSIFEDNEAVACMSSLALLQFVSMVAFNASWCTGIVVHR